MTVSNLAAGVPNPPRPITVFSVDELQSVDFREPWLVQQLLTVGGKLLLYGAAGCGKSTLTYELAACLATGVPFLDAYAIDRPHRVLVLQEELSVFELRKHTDQLATTHQRLRGSDELRFTSPTGLALPHDIDRLRGIIEQYRTEVLVVDPFLSFFRGNSIDNPVQVNEVLRSLDELLGGKSMLQGVVVVHHAGKPFVDKSGHERSPRTPVASYQFTAWPSTVIRLETIANSETDRRLVLQKLRTPLMKQGEQLRIRLGPGGYHATNPVPALALPRDEPIDSRQADVRSRLRNAGGSLVRSELLIGVGWPALELDAVLGSMSDEIEVSSESTGGRPRQVIRLRN